MRTARDRNGAPGQRLLVCLGLGGVGKTTISAALGVTAALGGANVDMMTIDPAARLLDALNLDPASSELREVELGELGHDGAGVDPRARAHLARPGRLRALKLDAKHTFDRLVSRYAPSVQARNAILENRIYRGLSAALAGVAHYMAVEQVLELCADSTASIIVLDTAPAAAALDFLDAPDRLLDLLNSRAIGLLGQPGNLTRRGFGMADLVARTVLRAFDRLTGLHLLSDVQIFITSFAGMYGGFAERAELGRNLVRGTEATLVVVTTPAPERVQEALEFIQSLRKSSLELGAVVVNRLTKPLPRLHGLRRSGLSKSLLRKVEQNHAEYAALRSRENQGVAMLRRELRASAPLVCVANLESEPSTLAELALLGRALKPLLHG